MLNEQQAKEAADKELKKRAREVREFLNEVVEVEKKHGYRLVAMLDTTPKGIIPRIVPVNLTEHPEYAAPKALEDTPEPKDKKILKKD